MARAVQNQWLRSHPFCRAAVRSLTVAASRRCTRAARTRRSAGAARGCGAARTAALVVEGMREERKQAREDENGCMRSGCVEREGLDEGCRVISDDGAQQMLEKWITFGGQ